MSNWYIAWKALKTGATGRGTGRFSEEEARRLAAELNSEHSCAGLLTHWAEEERP